MARSLSSTVAHSEVGPLARRGDSIVPQQVADEYVVYDLDSNRVHNLNPTAASVWQWCDGHTPADALAARLAEEHELSVAEAEPLLWLTLSKLEKADLLEAQLTRPQQYQRVNRRAVIKVLAGSALLPVVYTIVAPTAAHAQSNLPINDPCTSCEQCASGCCSDPGGGGVCADVATGPFGDVCSNAIDNANCGF